MSKNNAYCKQCHKKTKYNITKKQTTEIIRSLTVTYNERIATCEVCHSPVNVPELDYINSTVRRAAFFDALDETPQEGYMYFT